MRNREEASQNEASGERLIAGNDLHCRRREVSRYLAFISLPVSYMVSITLSRQTRGSLVRRSAIRAAFTAFTAAMALRSMHGTGPVRRPGHTSDRGCAPWRFPPRCTPAPGLHLTALPDQPPPLSTPHQLHPAADFSTRN